MKTPAWLFALRAAVIVLASAPLALVFRPHAALAALPLSEDGFYMLSVARNIGLGHGVTIDGSQWTNGFQPLFAFLAAPLYALCGGDRLEALRGVMALHAIAHVATAFLLAALVRDAARARDRDEAVAAYWVTALLWLASRHILVNAFNGLETGWALMLYAAALRLYQLGWIQGWRLPAFGVLLGALVLARIDAAVFVAALSLLEFSRAGSWRARLTRSLGLAVPAALISAPWWLYNLIGFGSLMPTSGTAQALPFSSERFGAMAWALLQIGAPYLQLRWLGEGPQRLLQAFALAAVLATCVLPWKRARVAIGSDPAMRAGAVLGLSTALLVFYYLFVSGAPHFYGRYLAPFTLLSVPLTAGSLTRALRSGRARAARPAILSFLFVLAAYGIASVTLWIFQRGVATNPHEDQIRLVRDRVPAGKLVAAGQSGTLGYFVEGVVNLDGKVNPDALKHRGRIPEYLEERGIEWYCDTETGYLGPDPAARGWKLVERRGMFAIHRREPRAPSL